MPSAKYHIEIDQVDKAAWAGLMGEFADASLYQTWAYGAGGSINGAVSHLVARDNGDVAGCCQAVIRRLPFLRLGIADIKWGPLSKNKDEHNDRETFPRLISALKEEYGKRRGYLVRIWPGAVGDEKDKVKGILEGSGFKCNPSGGRYRTLRLDLTPTLEELRKNLLQKWRNCLNKAEKNGLSIIEGTTAEHYQVFLRLLREMMSRKHIHLEMDYEKYGAIQDALPEHLKMRIMICASEREPLCVAIGSAIGDSGIYVFGATGDRGRGLNGAYLLQWRMIQWLKERGTGWYDLGGIDPVGNPGVYEFKLGVAGKNGRDEELLGEYYGCFSARARLTKQLLSSAKFLRQRRRARATARNGS